MQTIVHILGSRGAYHHIAAGRLFGEDVRVETCPGPEDVVKAAAGGGLAMLAVENSLAGEIPRHLAAIREAGIKPLGDCWLRIRLDLCVIPGSSMEDLQEVRSHPMAIKESRQFFSGHPGIRLREWSDTASAAYSVAEAGDSRLGAISSREAAKLYGLEVLAAEIEDHFDNWTRFMLLGSLPAGLSVKSGQRFS